MLPTSGSYNTNDPLQIGPVGCSGAPEVMLTSVNWLDKGKPKHCIINNQGSQGGLGICNNSACPCTVSQQNRNVFRVYAAPGTAANNLTPSGGGGNGGGGNSPSGPPAHFNFRDFAFILGGFVLFIVLVLVLSKVFRKKKPTPQLKTTVAA
jgi:hypothetical protein